LSDIVLLPDSLLSADADARLAVLAHEHAHLDRGDVWTLHAVNLLQLTAWIQPAFWHLKRRLRLDQDLLADAEAVRSTSMPADAYATSLLSIARSAARRPLLPLLPGLGALDGRPSSLARRITMLLDHRGALPTRAGRVWSACAASLVLVTALAAASLRLTASPLPPQQAAPVLPGDARPITLRGRVLDAATNAPIPGVTVAIRPGGSPSPRIHWAMDDAPVLPPPLASATTDTDGRYAVILPADTVARVRWQALGLDLDASRDGYLAPRMALPVAPFRTSAVVPDSIPVDDVTLLPVQILRGQVVTPDGQPAGVTRIVSYSNLPGTARMRTAPDGSQEPDPSFRAGAGVSTRSDPEGRFTLPVVTPGTVALQLEPDDERLPITRLLLDDGRRGDVGPVRLVPGVETRGRVVDAEGRGVAAVLVGLDSLRRFEDDSTLPYDRFTAAQGQGILDAALRRSALTDSDGTFVLGPVPPGSYSVFLASTLLHRELWASRHPDDAAAGRPRPLPAAYDPAGRAVTLPEGAPSLTLDPFRPVPSVEIRVQWQGPAAADDASLVGLGIGLTGRHPAGARPSGFSTTAPIDAQGRGVLYAPRGLTDVRLAIARLVRDPSGTRMDTRPAGTTRWTGVDRVEAGEGRIDRIGDDDATPREVTATHVDTGDVFLDLAAPDGRPVTPTRVFWTLRPPPLPSEAISRALDRCDFERMDDTPGRVRSLQAPLDRPFTIVVEAPGFERLEQVVSIASDALPAPPIRLTLRPLGEPAAPVPPGR
jgi:hypothetical protein